MKKDIPFYPVQNVIMAVAKENGKGTDDPWQVYVINRNKNPLETLMITSKGYGTQGGEEQKTSVLRHLIPKLEPGAYGLVESIMPNVFHLTNEYWVSYYIGNQIYDKKFIFVPDSIKEENLSRIKELSMQGVLHP